MNRNLLRPITQDELETFENDGVVWLREVLDTDWAAGLQAAINELVADPRGQAVDFTNLGLTAISPEAVRGFRAAGEWLNQEWGSPRQLRGEVLLDKRVAIGEGRRGHYLSITSAWRVHPFIRKMALNSPIPQIAACLMGSEGAYFCNDQLLVKPPGTIERTAWHQDQGYTLIQGEQVCAVRVPANEETREMGPVEYLRGSHKSGKIYKVNYFVSDVAAPDDNGEDIPHIVGHEADYDIVSFTPEPGDVVVHHLRTLHGAGGNASTVVGRGAVTFRYGGDDASYKSRKHAQPQESSPLRDGEPLSVDPDRYPVGWPAHD